MILGIVDLLPRKGTVYQNFQSVDHENEDTLKVAIISYPFYSWERNLHYFGGRPQGRGEGLQSCV